MNFFIIVPSVMALVIFLLHHFTDYIGLKIKYQSLILCAVLSFFVNIAALFLSDTLNSSHYIHIGILVLIGAIVASFYNNWLLRRDEMKNVISSVDEAAARREAESEQMIEREKQILMTRTIKALDLDESHEDIPIEPPKQIPSKIEESKTESEIESKIEESKIEIQKSETQIENPKIESKIESKIEPKIEEKIEPSKIEPEVVETPKLESKVETPKAAIPKIEESIKRSEDRERVEPTESIEPAIVEVEKKIDPPAQKISNTSILAYKVDQNEVFSRLESLDDILDYAADQRDSGNLQQALFAYQKALDRYKNDDYAPFIAIEIGNIYKEQAQYSKAIRVYEDSLTLPALKHDLESYREFSRNLLYLRTVQLVLLRHRVLQTPYSKISKSYMAEIEQVFAERSAK